MQVFKYIKLDELRPISMAILRCQQDIPSKILSYLRNNPELLSQCSLNAKRQVWTFDIKVFNDTLLPLIEKFAADARAQWLAFDYATAQELHPSHTIDSPYLRVRGPPGTCWWRLRSREKRGVLVLTPAAPLCAARAARRSWPTASMT